MLPGTVPSLVSRSRTSGLASAAFTSLLILAATSAGMFAGPQRPTHSV